MEFEKRKLAVLATMTSPEPDKSPKGSIDTPIIPLLNTLNSHPSYFTTSSCSGRISIFSHPTTTAAAAAAAKKKAKGGTWVFISHEPANPDSVLNILNESTQGDTLVFRFEPLIIAIECKDLSSAQSLISLAIASGFRESGITSVNKRVIIAIRCSIRLEVPLGDTQKLMVTHDYLRYLIEVANEKMEANRRRTDSFLQTLLKNGFSDSADSGIPESLQNFEDNGGDGDVDSGKKDDDDTHCGSKIISLTKMDIDGEPLERLFLWGHSACVLENINGSKIIVFGGFGGIGRHSRRNDSLIFDPVLGGVEDIVVKRAPSPRLGHTASMVGDRMFVVGGRGDPTSILNEVWALDIAKSEWRQLQCSGSVFSPRHRHATAVIGSKIYVFGGIHNDVVSSSLFVLDTNNLEWSEIPVQGEWPCPRHSHSMVPYKSSLFMFGGYDGEKALGDLYSFDVETHTWRKENMLGEKPYPRFSHSMFVYNDFVGIIGGCPIKQHCNDLSLLDLKTDFWNNIEVKCIDEGLFVRSTASVVGDELVLIGGGASCYAFGTKFSEPMKMNLRLLIRDNPFVTKKKNDKSDEEKHEKKSKNGRNSCSANWVLKIEKKYAKFGKDLLKKFEWLDLGRKVYAEEGGACICFPITGKFSDMYENKRRSMTEQFELLEGKGVLLKDVSCSTALNLLMAYGASMVPDEVVKVKKERNCPLKIMSEGVASLIERKGLPTQLLEQLPSRWERLGDILVLPTTSFKDPIWDSIGDELWPIIAKSLGGGRLARQGRVAPTGTRDSTLEILVGDNGWVNHRENGILYSFNATKCMFSWGNLSEKLRMANLDCKNEVIVDLFAGIGYFVLPFLVGANAKLVYACEWNPNAIEALRRNVDANSVSDRCIILEGDNRITAPKGIADRVCLGLLPTSEGSWVTAVRALRREGGILHVHGNVKDSEEGSWTEHVTKSIAEISKTEGRCWEVTVEHVERVKWYAPHIRHLVADVRCNQIQNREEIL